jgi:VIT1/CCC1 family predicted Fe2+/Mn2+ transporter
VIAEDREVLLATKVAKAFGLAIEEASGSALQGALVMGAAFALGALAPVLPYVVLPVDAALVGSMVATGVVLFGIGVVKTRWTGANPIWSGVEILLIGAAAGVVGYLFGTILPALLGAPPVSG